VVLRPASPAAEAGPVVIAIDLEDLEEIRTAAVVVEPQIQTWRSWKEMPGNGKLV
jgi:hypothetical protein